MTGSGSLAFTPSMPIAKAAGNAIQQAFQSRTTCISASGFAAMWLMSQRLCSPQRQDMEMV